MAPTHPLKLQDSDEPPVELARGGRAGSQQAIVEASEPAGRLVDPLADARAAVERELEDQRRAHSRPRLVWALYGLGTLITGGCLAALVLGWSYYRLPAPQRPFHSLHDALRASGSLGLSAGILGTLLIAGTFVYVFRKNLVRGVLSGSKLQAWMQAHIAAGMLGTLLITVHSGLLPTSMLGSLGLVGLLVTVASGVAGRYFLRFVPLELEESAAGPEQIQRRLEVYEQKLRELGMAEESPQSEEIGPAARPWLLTSLVRVILGDADCRRRRRRLERAVAQQKLGAEAREVLELVRRQCMERQLLIRFYELRKLLGSWRFLHRWLAIVLVLAVVLHIVVALQYGSLWILGGGH